jgi:hypothetical protein
VNAALSAFQARDDAQKPTVHDSDGWISADTNPLAVRTPDCFSSSVAVGADDESRRVTFPSRAAELASQRCEHVLACMAGREAGEDDGLGARVVAGCHVRIMPLRLSAVSAAPEN